MLCYGKKNEKAFKDKMREFSLNSEILGLITAFVFNLFMILLESVQIGLSLEFQTKYRLLIQVIEETLTIALILLFKKYNFKNWFSYALYFLNSIDILLFFVLNLFDTENGIYIYIDIMYFYLRFLLLNFCSGLLFSKLFLLNMAIILIWFLKLSLYAHVIENYLFSFLFISCVISTKYLRESACRQSLSIQEIFKNEIDKTESLLTQMMPANALKNLQEETTNTDKLNQVTIMYADIVGFTAWSSTRSPIEVVEMLSELFTKFDEMCLEHDVYKVHTIGDCYVAMGYVTDFMRNPAKEASNVVNFALSLIDVINDFNVKTNSELGMRIGIHTGIMIGGIVGTKIIRYDIYGQDVVIANKVESNGIQGKVSVSQSTKELLEGYMPSNFSFSDHKEIKTPLGKLALFTLNDQEL